MNYEVYGLYIAYTAVYVLCAVALKYAMNYACKDNYVADDQLREGNMAVGLRRVGAQFGLGIALLGVLMGGSTGSLVEDLGASLLYGLLSVGFMLMSLVTVDRWVVASLDNSVELAKGNIAVGMVEFGATVATGLIAFASVLGEGGGILSSLAYFAVGQLSLVALVLIYEKVVVKHNLVEAIKNGQVASGIYLAGKLIAYALILKSVIADSTATGSVQELAMSFAVMAVIGMILLYIFEWIIDKVIITSTSVEAILRDNLMVPALQLSVMKVSVALILSVAIL